MKIKCIIALILCASWTQLLFAQTGKFGLNEAQQYVYYEEVSQAGNNAEVLLKKAENSLENVKALKNFKLKLQKGMNFVRAEKSIQLYKGLSFVTHPEEQIDFKIQIDVKNDRYRILFTDFVYVPLERDRFGNYSSAGQIPIQFEKSSGKFIGKYKENILVKTGIQCQLIAEKIKKSMASTFLNAQPVVVKDTIKTNKW